MVSTLFFELKAKDLAGRLGKLTINNKTVDTPLLMPVYNPNKPLLSVDDLKNLFGVKALMTNAYILLRNQELREKAEADGIHKLLGFDGLVATDSGSFQLMSYGSVSTTNSEIIGFQEKIGSDIGSFLDVPTLPDAYKPRAVDDLDETLKRAEEAKDADFVVNAGIQGSTYVDLRAKAAKVLGKKFRLCAVGGIVRLMEEYRFSDLVDIIAAVKKNLPSDRVVHAFGLGHPMVFSFAVALGCDLFDSAAYALYAQDGRYMTEYGTRRLDELDFLPCSCPVCSRYGMELKAMSAEEKTRNLALHNLYVTFEELNRVKQAIKEGSLWNLLALRSRTHPSLFAALMRLRRYVKWIARLDSITKHTQVYYSGSDTSFRPEVLNARKRLKRVSSTQKTYLPPFGFVPVALFDIYPFGGFVPVICEKELSLEVSDLDKLRAIMEYQFGEGAGKLIGDGFRIKRSRSTQRIRWIYKGSELIASVRASDHFIIPHRYLAERLKEKFAFPRLRVVVEDDAVPFVSEGKSVFAKFVALVDKSLNAGDEVLVVSKNDDLLGVGTLVLSPKEALEFERGPAVKMR